MTAETEAGRSRARELQRLTEQLSSAATPQDIGRLTGTTAATLLEADSCGVYVRASADPEVLEALYVTGVPGEAVDRYRRVRIRGGRPVSDAVLSGARVGLEDAAQWRPRYPQEPSAGVSGGLQACACLPLRVDDQDVGAVVFRFREPRVFGPGEREFLVAVASLGGQPLDRARLNPAEKQARRAAERERDRMTFLARASQLMEAPLSVEERLQR